MSTLEAIECLQAVQRSICDAAKDVGRVHDDITLIAVSKTFEPEAIRPVLSSGHQHFGENRVQEAQRKWPQLKSEFADVTLHLIGPLQSNKTSDAVALFDVIHTVDRPKIAQALARECQKQRRELDLFIQVNTGEEPQKAGVMPSDLPDFAKLCRQELKLSISGLMCIPPVDEEAAVHFAFLHKLSEDIGVSQLSMGMSADFTTAVQLGASHVRVGSGIFGLRS